MFGRALITITVLAEIGVSLIGQNDARAMDFILDRHGDRAAIRAVGEILPGDAAKLRNVAHLATENSRGLRGIFLNSPGGSVEEAKAISDTIRAFDFMTMVDGECASACSMILYPAGLAFLLLEGGKLGFHPCYNRRDLKEIPECTEQIAQLAALRGFPYGSVKVYASMAEPTDMYWVTNVLSPCYGMERFPGDPPPTSQTLPCPYTIQTLINSGFRKPDERFGPSFDCTGASEPIELLLCSDRELMHLDSIMGDLYRMLMRQRDRIAKSQLRLAQREWIKTRGQACPLSAAEASTYADSRESARCISEHTISRMSDLLAANGTPLLPLADLFKRATEPLRK